MPISGNPAIGRCPNIYRHHPQELLLSVWDFVRWQATPVCDFEPSDESSSEVGIKLKTSA